MQMHPATPKTRATAPLGGDSQFFTVPDMYPNSVTLSSREMFLFGVL
jgi:hypothetical protein